MSDIEAGFVKLTGPTNEIELPVGMQLRREDAGEWYIAARAEPPPVTFARSTPRPSSGNDDDRPSSSPVNQAEPPVIILDPSESQVLIADPNTGTVMTNGLPEAASGGAENDVLRRLMQRRQQENNQ